MGFLKTSLYAWLIPAAALAAPSCHEFTMPIAARTKVRPIVAPGFDLTTVSGVESLLSSGIGILGQGPSFFPISGTYDIGAVYCEPQKTSGAPASRAKTVQLLFHGVPYNKAYWAGNDWKKPKRYSWVDYATSLGYPTLSIDNVGTGNSTHPDPLLETQQPLQVEITHNIVKKMRAGKLKKYGVPKAEKVVYVGHSLGSVVGNGIATKYPKALDALMLTGYTYTVIQGAIGLLGTELTPASIHDPDRFGDLAPAYITFGSQKGKRNTYYGDNGFWSRPLAAFDFAHEDVTSVGAIASATTGLMRADNFVGEVMAITGQRDALFCSVGSRAIEIPDCGEGDDSIPARTKEFWPRANFRYHIPKGTGHATTLHYTTQGSLKAAHDFLKQSGY